MMIFVITKDGHYINTDKVIAYNIEEICGMHRIFAHYQTVKGADLLEIAAYEDKKTAEKMLDMLIKEIVFSSVLIQSGHAKIENHIIDVKRIEKNVQWIQL